MIFQRNTWWALLAAGLVLTSLYIVRGVLLPFLMGMIIAYIFNPLIDKGARCGVPRSLGTTAVIAVLCCLSLGFLVVVIPFVTAELLRFAQNLPRYAQLLFLAATPWMERLSDYLAVKDLEELRHALTEYLTGLPAWALSFFSGLLTNTLALANMVSLIVLTPITAFYLLRDWPRVIDTLGALVPRSHVGSTQALCSSINKNLGAYLRGQLIVSTLLGSFLAIALSFAHLKYAITIGCMTGLLSIIPYVGMLISVLISVGIAYAQQPEFWYVLMIVGIFATASTLEGFIAPPLIGHSIGIHPVWIMFALLGLGQLFGLTGMLLSMPVAAIVGATVRFALARYRESRFYLRALPDQEGR